MSKVDKMRAAQRKRHPIETATEKIVESAREEIMAIDVSEHKKKPQMARFRCGHEKPLSHFQGADCGECRAKAQKAKAAKRREKHQANKIGKADQVWRWPDGTHVEKDWRNGSWSCLVWLPNTGKTISEDPADFQQYASGSMRAEQMCWEQYLASLKAKG